VVAKCSPVKHRLMRQRDANYRPTSETCCGRLVPVTRENVRRLFPFVLTANGSTEEAGKCGLNLQEPDDSEMLISCDLETEPGLRKIGHLSAAGTVDKDRGIMFVRTSVLRDFGFPVSGGLRASARCPRQTCTRGLLPCRFKNKILNIEFANGYIVQ
jgi:hypothetical protein